MKYKYLLWTSLLVGTISTTAQAYQLAPVVITFKPVAPPILDRAGTGFCMVSRTALYAKLSAAFSGNMELDASSVFGSENSPPPNACWAPNIVDKGGGFPLRLNSFFDEKYFPKNVLGPTVSNKMDKPLDLSNHPRLPDPNGDFWGANTPACDPHGCPFIPLELLPNFNRNATYPDNRYFVYVNPPPNSAQLKNFFWPKMYPESQPDTEFTNTIDEIHDTAFRLRAYLNITPDRTRVPIVFGMYVDDAASLVFYDAQGQSANVISIGSNRCRACDFFHPCAPRTTGEPVPACNAQGWCEPCDLAKTGARWRVTNEVFFQEPGLYPIEIIYAQFSGNAALEVAVKVLKAGETSTPIYESWGYPPANYSSSTSRPLSELGFSLLDPSWLFQTPTGDSIECTQGQCQRLSKTDPNFGAGCNAGNSCNTAGICQPCNSADKCGINCITCPNNAKKCLGGQCVECTEDVDCGTGRICDKAQNKCFDCTKDTDCAKGMFCQNKQCVPCSDKNQCAGNSCGCCPGSNKCTVVKGRGDLPVCVECIPKSECPPNTVCDSGCPSNMVCDSVNRRCVEKIAQCNTDDHCGADCKTCPTDRPFCLNGTVCVACRTDLNCAKGEYCLSGQCSSCTTDRRCGATCHPCSPDKPFCLSGNGDANQAQCVQCTKDEQCGPGGTCDVNSHTCQNPCTLSCPAGQFCNGDRCVQCLSSAQCSCERGESCDLDSGTCVPGCQDTTDCQANECCSPLSHECESGRCKSLVIPAGGALCCSATGTSTNPTDAPPTSWARHAFWITCLATAAGIFLFARRRRIWF